MSSLPGGVNTTGNKAGATTTAPAPAPAPAATTRSSNTGKRSWDENYARLLEYHGRFHHCHVPYNWPDDPALSWWLSDQRKRQSRLPADQKSKLDALGFSWENPKTVKEQQQWDVMFQLLQQHKQQRGDCNPPQTWKPGGPKLTRWVARQREYYKQNNLSAQRKERLEGIDFTWESPVASASNNSGAHNNTGTSSSSSSSRRAPQNMDKNNERWQRQYQTLVAFFKQHGHTRVPQKDKSLGAWTKKQREKYSKNLLQEDRLALLNQIGFEWSLPDAQFLEHYEAAKAFKEKYGHLRVPAVSVGGCNNNNNNNNNNNHNNMNKKLSDWMYRQRKAHSLGKLDQQRKRLLDEIEFPWEVEPRSATITTTTITGLPAKMMRRSSAEDDMEGGGGELAVPGGSRPTPQQQQQQQHTTAIMQQQQPQQMGVVHDTNSIVANNVNVRKRFQHGWVNGQRIQKVRTNFHHVRFSDGLQEYMSDEEFEVASFAYRNFRNRTSTATTTTTRT